MIWGWLRDDMISISRLMWTMSCSSLILSLRMDFIATYKVRKWNVTQRTKQMQISHWGSLENKYRCYLLAKRTIAKTKLRNTPLSCLSFTAKTSFSCNRKHQVLTILGLGSWVFFIKQRLLNMARFIYSRNSDPLKKKRRWAPFAGCWWLNVWGAIQTTQLHRAAVTVVTYKSITTWPSRSQFCLKPGLWGLQPVLCICSCSEGNSFLPSKAPSIACGMQRDSSRDKSG